MSRRLELLFENEEGGNVTISIDNPAEPVDPASVSAAMDVIVSENAFITANGSISGKRGARIVERNVEPVEFDAE